MIDKYKIADKYFAPFGDPKELGDAISLYLSNNEICMCIAPDRASTTRIWYEKELQKEGAKRANI